ncbi:MAG TPA: hypothetical protein VFJ57_02310 [Solirubrobacterales bacterium]|nr:hypothetical protein [Solirubrobacterales bacterium]
MAVLPTPPESIEAYLAEDPSRRVFSAMVTDPEYLEVAELRTRGLEDSLLQATRALFPQPAGG